MNRLFIGLFVVASVMATGAAAQQATQYARQDQGREGDQRRVFAGFAAVLVHRRQQRARRLFDRHLQARHRADRARGGRAESQGELARRHDARAAADGCRRQGRPRVREHHADAGAARQRRLLGAHFLDAGGFIVRTDSAIRQAGRHGRQEDRRAEGDDHRDPPRDRAAAAARQCDGGHGSTPASRASRWWRPAAWTPTPATRSSWSALR